MNGLDVVQLAAFIGVLGLTTPILGGCLARILAGAPPAPLRWLAPVEHALYRLAGCRPEEEMSWRRYLASLAWFNLLGLLALLGLQLLQGHLPLNPQHFPDVPPALALNTAVSFVTNTNWQAYSGEAALSPLTQMLGLGVQNFLSAATGLAVLLALTRGLARRSTATVGNFWADIVRNTLYVLLPLSTILALALVSQGVVQTLAPYPQALSVEGAAHEIPLGPAASQVAIKQLGTNGGGFFGANSAHPFENPTPLSNFLQVLAILLLPAALTHTYGRMVGSPRQGWVLFAAMAILFTAGLGAALWAEHQPNPVLGHFPHLEGKETRFGIVNSTLWAVATTAASNGSVNAMHDSLSPIGGLVALFNLLLGEVVFGGVGAGLYGLLMCVILTVFLAGLMVGRTPEYLGKRIQAREVTLAMTAVLAPCGVVLLLSALACTVPAGLASLNNPGPHGLSEILYAFASMANNNGSAFAGLNANTPFYNLLGALAMAVGRFVVIVPALALAGSLAHRQPAPPSPGTFPTDGPLFVVLLCGVVVIVAGLTFLPALTLGPVLEHLLMLQGRSF